MHDDLQSLQERRDQYHDDLLNLQTRGATDPVTYTRLEKDLHDNYRSYLAGVLDRAGQEAEELEAQLSPQDIDPLTFLSDQDLSRASSLLPLIERDFTRLTPTDLRDKAQSVVKSKDKGQAYIYHKLLTELLDDDDKARVGQRATTQPANRAMLREATDTLAAFLSGKTQTAQEREDAHQRLSQIKRTRTYAMREYNRLQPHSRPRENYSL